MRTRQQFLLVLVTGLLTSPLPSLAQQKEKVWRIGIISSRARPTSLDADFDGQIPLGLRELGYVEGKNLTIEWRFAGGDYERLANMAMELVRLPVDVIVSSGGTPPALAAQRATKTIPIVFVGVGDPVAVGLVGNLARPEGNVTGLSIFANDTVTKQMEMLAEIVPGLSRMAYLSNPANQGTIPQLTLLKAAALLARVEIITVEAQTPPEIAGAFARIRGRRVAALIVPPDPLFLQQAAQIAREAALLRLPTVGGDREFAEAGGLMSYGADRWRVRRRSASYIDKILRGARPQDLPVERPTKLELVLNRKTAKALGLKFPPDLLVLADKVIE